ncbi:MAG: S8 family peptidase [Sandarakinorhabdus sp.]|nr:S8 family peptidase [Sandarakinorhabdus sp.]
MNKHIDPQLGYLLDAASDAATPFEDMAESGMFGLAAAGARDKPAATEVEVLVQATVDSEALHKAGLSIRSELGDVFTGTIRLDKLEKLAALDGVELVEAARTMAPELDLAIVDTRVNLVHAGPPGRRGSGVIVGIADSGIDFTHPAFRNPDGSTRILAIWDQTLARTGSEVSPAPFGYGVVYNRAQIDAALATANPFATVRHQVGAGDHGTHVAGIAAGNGRGSSATQPEFRFMGVAPEADIIVVRVGGGGGEGFGTSANALDAVNFCYQQAAALTRPCVVNMSLGDNLGPHDGTSLLERGLDNLLGGQGRAFVKSAGNAGDMGQHAGGTVANGATVDVGINMPTGRTTEIVDVWYPGGSTFRAQIFDPDGNATAVVNVGAAPTNATLPGGNVVRIDHRNNDAFNGDKRVFITITRGTAGQIRAGSWRMRLISVSSAGGGRFDAWIQRPVAGRATFLAPHRSNERTISTPGTARKVITVANYAAGAPGAGSLNSSSSRGPTRDGRAAPTLAAPGTNVFSASSRFGTGNPYIAMTGTSMSAPHVTGVIALMFQKNPNRTQEQIRDCLTSTARADAFTGPLPNTGWGAGKVDAQAAVNCVPAVLTPVRTVIGPSCRSVIVVTCPRPSVATPCVTVVATRCPTLVATCPPRTLPLTCGPRTLPALCSPNTSPLSCLQRTFPAMCGGPSIVDGCPSTPGGCDPFTVVVNPTVTVINPTIVQPGGPIAGPIAGPGGFGMDVEQVAQAAAATAYWSALQAMMGPMMGDASQAAGQAGEGEAASGAGLPAEGYYEYDESWFDPDNTDGSDGSAG